MDIITATVTVAFIVILAARIVEIASKRPQTFLEMTAGARAFAEGALADAATARAAAAPVVQRPAAELDEPHRPALAA